MAEKIVVGDLVMIVRASHSCLEPFLGKIYRVTEVPSSLQYLRCRKCFSYDIGQGQVKAVFAGGGALMLSCIRKIKEFPLEELQADLFHG